MQGTVRDVSRLLLLAKSRVYALIKLGVLPKPSGPGGFDMERCVQGYIRYLRKPTGAVDQDIRCKTLKADLLEMRVRERAGELVRADAVENDAFALYRAVRDNFLNIPDRVSGPCAAESDQHKIHALLTKEITQVLQTLADETNTLDRGTESPRPGRGR